MFDAQDNTHPSLHQVVAKIQQSYNLETLYQYGSDLTDPDRRPKNLNQVLPKFNRLLDDVHTSLVNEEGDDAIRILEHYIRNQEVYGTNTDNFSMPPGGYTVPEEAIEELDRGLVTLYYRLRKLQPTAVMYLKK